MRKRQEESMAHPREDAIDRPEIPVVAHLCRRVRYQFWWRPRAAKAPSKLGSFCKIKPMRSAIKGIKFSFCSYYESVGKSIQKLEFRNKRLPSFVCRCGPMEIAKPPATQLECTLRDRSFAAYCHSNKLAPSCGRGGTGRRNGLERLSARRETGGVELPKLGETFKGNPEPSPRPTRGQGRCRD